MHDSYDTIAEVAVAVVGFVAIVTALKKETPTDVEQVLTKHVLFEPIAVVMFALFPSLVQASGLNPEISLRVSLTVFALCHLCLCYWVYIGFRPYLGSQISRPFFTSVNAIAVTLCIVQLLAATALIPVAIYFLYLLGLYWLLGMCFLNFVTLFTREKTGDA